MLDGCFRRVSPVPAHSGDCLLSEARAGTLAWALERVLMPRSRHSFRLSERSCCRYRPSPSEGVSPILALRFAVAPAKGPIASAARGGRGGVGAIIRLRTA